MTLHAHPDAAWLGVEIDISSHLDEALGLIAAAYDDDPDTVGALLEALAAANRRVRNLHDDAEVRDVPDCVIDAASAEADRACEDLADALPSDGVVARLNGREARELAAELTAAADRTSTARIRRSAA